jgi:hypothetical protein
MKGAVEHSFEATVDQIKVSGPTGSGEFKISRKADNKTQTYTMKPRNENTADTAMIMSFIREQLGATQ